MAEVICVSPPDFTVHGVKSGRGRNAATQAPDLLKSPQFLDAKLPSVISAKIMLKDRMEIESDWDSNYHSSDKSIGATPSPEREKRVTPKEVDDLGPPTPSTSSSENTTPTSSRTGSQNLSQNIPVVAISTDDHFKGQLRVLAEPIDKRAAILIQKSAPRIYPQSKVAPSDALEKKRVSLQSSTERFSLLILLPSLLMLFLSPWLMLPIFTIPNPSTRAFMLAMLIGTPLGLICLTLGCLLGNVVWYHDPESGKWRWFLHCGKRFEDHYWGDDLFHGFKKKLKPSSTSVV